MTVRERDFSLQTLMGGPKKRATQTVIWCTWHLDLCGL